MNSLHVLGILFLGIVAMAFVAGSKRNGFLEGYFNERVESHRDHPVLAYQRQASFDTAPASWGDPIRPPYQPLGVGPSGGPLGSNLSPKYHYNANQQAYAYDSTDGPATGRMMNVPVQAGALKMSNEKWDYPFYYQKQPLAPYDYFKPYGPNQSSMQQGLGFADTPFYKRFNEGQALGYTGSGGIPFISSVSSYAPFPEVTTPWEKIGMIQAINHNDGLIMNLYRRPIAPLQDLFEYMVQDKNGFMIPLRHKQLLENGDIIPAIQGFESLGPWKCNIYVDNKWVWA